MQTLINETHDKQVGTNIVLLESTFTQTSPIPVYVPTTQEVGTTMTPPCEAEPVPVKQESEEMLSLSQFAELKKEVVVTPTKVDHVIETRVEFLTIESEAKMPVKKRVFEEPILMKDIINKEQEVE